MIDPLLPSAQLADDPILEPPALPSMCAEGLGARERAHKERDRINRIKKKSEREKAKGN